MIKRRAGRKRGKTFFHTSIFWCLKEKRGIDSWNLELMSLSLEKNVFPKQFFLDKKVRGLFSFTLCSSLGDCDDDSSSSSVFFRVKSLQCSILVSFFSPMLLFLPASSAQTGLDWGQKDGISSLANKKEMRHHHCHQPPTNYRDSQCLLSHASSKSLRKVEN